jgi:hypothetical protein
MKALLQAGLTGRVPAPPEKRFLISCPEHNLWVDFDRFCECPREAFSGVRDFLGISSHQGMPSGLERIAPPASRGRYKNHDLTQLDAHDIAYTQSVGYPVN